MNNISGALMRAAMRHKLINKPSWDNAPGWAKWLVQAPSDGSWYWVVGSKPILMDYQDGGAPGWSVDPCSAMEASDGHIPAGHDWRETLEERPMCVGCYASDSLEGVTTTLGASPDFDEERIDIISTNGATGDHYMTPEEEELPAEEKHTCDRCGGSWWAPMNSECPCREGKQLRYMDRHGEDWIDEFARTATVDEFRGAMRFTLGKYNRRAGKKDELINEIRKMRDYCDRWIAYELEVSEAEL